MVAPCRAAESESSRIANRWFETAAISPLMAMRSPQSLDLLNLHREGEHCELGGLWILEAIALQRAEKLMMLQGPLEI